MRSTARNGKAGFSLLELLFTLVIVSLALAIAAHLMIEAQRRATIEQRRALEPVVAIALKQLRGDVTAAVDASGRSEDGEALTLTLPSGVVVYELVAGELVRSLDGLPGRRVLLRDVTELTWRRQGGARPLLEIDLEYVTTRSTGPEVAAGRRVTVPRGLERRTLHLALRGGGGVGW